MAGRRINRSRAGIESAVLAVLLVIIAIALASIVYIFASTQTQSLARSAKIDIIDAKYLTGTSPTATGNRQEHGERAGNDKQHNNTRGIMQGLRSPSKPALNPGEHGVVHGDGVPGPEPRDEGNDSRPGKKHDGRAG